VQRTPSYLQLRQLQDALAVCFGDPKRMRSLDGPAAEAFVRARRQASDKEELQTDIEENAERVAGYADEHGIDAGPLRRLLESWSPRGRRKVYCVIDDVRNHIKAIYKDQEAFH